MTQKEKSAEMVRKNIRAIRCSLCNSPMKVVDFKSLICSNNHSFDFAKQGYVNMLIRSTNSHYDKKLFAARQKIIMESNLYALLHQKIAEVINKRIPPSNDEIRIFDAGCGEGSHLKRILDECKNEAMTGIGLDISKEGIRMAARHYRQSIWLVGDLANSPLANQSCQVIMNILSPANYTDFKRILVSDGLIVKIVPGPHYLKELRDACFDDTDKLVYKNDKTVSLFKEHFHLVDMIHVSYTTRLSQLELLYLVQMSPIAWNSKKEQLEQFTNQAFSDITVDLDILIGVKKQTKGDGA